MRDASTISVTWQEDGSATALARVTARDATGQFTGVSGEGRWIKQADLSTITCKVFQRTGTTTPDTAVFTPSVVIATAIYDTPQVDGEIWDESPMVGFNFLHDLAGTNFPNGGQTYRVEYVFETTSGTKWTLSYEGESVAVVST